MAFQGDSIFWVEVEKIVPNPYQPRREFDDKKLEELSESIKMYGVLQPLTVSRKEMSRDDGTFFTEYELIAGERRLRASRLAGLAQVPVIIREGEDSEQEKLELAIIENLQREDLNAVDRALAFKQLADAFELSHAQVAKKVGRSREYVSNSIRILNLPEHILDALRRGDISEGHARTLLMLNDRPEEMDTVFREILLKKLSVREVERIARKIATDKVRKKHWAGTDPELMEIEKQFTETLGTRVQIQKTDYGGKLTIDYFSSEDLEAMLGRFRQEAPAAAALTTEHTVDEMETLEEATALERFEEAPVVPQADDELYQSLEAAFANENNQSNTYQESDFPDIRPLEDGDENDSLDESSESVTLPDSGVFTNTPELEGEERVEEASASPTQTPEESLPAVETADEATQSLSTDSPDDESDLYSIRHFSV